VSQDYQITNNQTLFTIHNESGLDLPISQPDVEELGGLVSSNESCSFGLIEVVYVDENAILETNRSYLNHDYVTDIITFPYQDSPAKPGHSDDRFLDGTLFCCAQRIAEQAADLEEKIENEFRRVFIHGLLHLVGYNDKTDEERMIMRDRENFYLKAYEERHAK